MTGEELYKVTGKELAELKRQALLEGFHSTGYPDDLYKAFDACHSRPCVTNSKTKSYFLDMPDLQNWIETLEQIAWDYNLNFDLVLKFTQDEKPGVVVTKEMKCDIKTLNKIIEERQKYNEQFKK